MRTCQQDQQQQQSKQQQSPVLLRPTSIVRYLRNSTYKPSYMRGLDFNMESLCRYVENNGRSDQAKPRDVGKLDKLVSHQKIHQNLEVSPSN